jgi:flagellar P-ring protein precursor FlgI
MRRIARPLILLTAVALVVAIAAAPRAALAVKVADVTRIGGTRTNILTGMGLVVGLKGTGDGGDFLPAIRPLAATLAKFNNQANLSELGNAKNVAVVMLTATVPANGVRAGDKLDVYVTSIGAAQSLKNGRLFVTPMQGPLPDKPMLLALSSGPIDPEDPSTPTVGVIKGGCVMEVDLLPRMIDQGGRFTLVIEEPSASWTMASNIAKVINDSEDGQVWAVAVDPKNVVVTIPPSERDRPDSFISRVQRLPVPLVAAEARVQLNSRTGTIVITGDVEISPVVISHKGLTITTVKPEPQPTPARPVVEQRDFVAIDPQNSGGAKLQDLLKALDQLKVPAADRIAIVRELHKTGKLHAKLIEEQ